MIRYYKLLYPVYFQALWKFSIVYPAHLKASTGGIARRDRQDHGRWRHRSHAAGLEGLLLGYRISQRVSIPSFLQTLTVILHDITVS